MSQNVQLITFGKRESSLERNHGDFGGDDTWRQSPLYGNRIPGSTAAERERFLPPVKLDPGWDSMVESNSSKKSSTAQLIEELEKDAPRDRYYIVYFIMVLQGIAVLLPWNAFINAKDYFENYKLSSGNETASPALEDYRTNFMSYIGMASQYPNFLMNILNIFVQCGGNTLGIRILSGISVMVVMIVVTVVLAMFDTSAWPETFFWITIITVILINAAVGIYQNSLYGLAAMLPMKYTNAVVFGSNISGTLVAVTNIILIVLSPSVKTSAIYYFVTAIIILMIAFDGYFILGHTAFFRHFMKLSSLKKLEYQENNDQNVPFYRTLFGSFGRVVKQIYHLIFGVFFTFFITLLLFPAVTSDVLPVSAVFINIKNLWTAIFCFLFFNLFATLGNLTTIFIQWPNARWINVLVLLRMVFIPLMILGNFRPENRVWLPIVLPYDWVFIVSSILFSFSSGYCSSLTMMYAPSCVTPSDAPIAGMIMALSLALGILTGINCSRLWGFV